MQNESGTRTLFLASAATLIGVGVVMVYSASVTSRPTYLERIYLSKHAAFVGVGIGIAAVCSLLSAGTWKRLSPWLFLATLVLLALVLIPGIGTRVNGAQRWFRAGGFSLQPSEIAKLTLPLFLARVLTAFRGRLNHWFHGTVVICLPIAITVPLVFLEPDLGTAFFLALGAGVMLWIAGWPLRNFVLATLVVGIAVGTLVSWKPYQIKRLTGFVQTWTDPASAPYQVRQSLATLGSGGLSGVGVGNGWQKLSFLPEAHTDFVVAVIGEEFGLVGTLGLAVMWTLLFASGARLISRYAATDYARLAGMTLLMQLAAQAAINVAVVCAMLPPKGIPHPMLSYGGTNLLVNLATIGVILSLTRDAQTRCLDGRTEEHTR